MVCAIAQWRLEVFGIKVLTSGPLRPRALRAGYGCIRQAGAQRTGINRLKALSRVPVVHGAISGSRRVHQFGRLRISRSPSPNVCLQLIDLGPLLLSCRRQLSKGKGSDEKSGVSSLAGFPFRRPAIVFGATLEAEGGASKPLHPCSCSAAS